MAVRTGMERALPGDGRGSVAGVAGTQRAWHVNGAGAVRRTAGAERAVDVAVLRVAEGRARLCRDHPAVAARRSDHGYVLAHPGARRGAAGPVPRVGQLRRRAVLRGVAAKSVGARLAPRPLLSGK